MKIQVGKRDAYGDFPVRFTVRRNGETFTAVSSAPLEVIRSTEFVAQGMVTVLEKANARPVQRIAQVKRGLEK